MHYLTMDGTYYEGDQIDVADVRCAARPSPNYVLKPSWQANPLNPNVVWREKTPIELAAESEAECAEKLDVDTLLRLIFAVSFDLESRLRFLQGLPDVSREQYRTSWLNAYAQLEAQTPSGPMNVSI